MDQLLIIDNDAELCQLLTRYLETEGFNIQCSHDATIGLKAVLSQNFQAVILDLMLPDMNGFDVLKKIREASQLPVLMLSAKSGEVDKIICLELGADDYITKPCNPRELLARLKAILRRNGTVKTISKTISIGILSIEPNKHSAYVNKTPLDLTNAEYNILQMLMCSPEQAFSKEELTEHALNRKYTAFDRSIDVHISNLRNKLSASDYSDPAIKTVRGFGYMFSENKSKEEK